MKTPEKQSESREKLFTEAGRVAMRAAETVGRLSRRPDETRR